MAVYDDTKLTDVESAADDIEQNEDSKLDYTVKMSSEEREDLGRRLKQEIEKYHAYTETRRGNAVQWRRDYELMPTGRSTRWKGSSDIPSPLIHIYALSHHTRL